MKNVYFFHEEESKNRELVGGKGFGLAEMTHLGLPVPPGFTIPITVCKIFYDLGGKLPEELMGYVREAVKNIESRTGKRFGDKDNPLLVSVRSGAAISMPGMMDSVLNLGLNDQTVEGLIKYSNDERFAFDSYRRFLHMFGRIVLGIEDELFSNEFEELRSRRSMENHELSADDLRYLTERYKELIKSAAGTLIEDPYTQLELAICAIFRSWYGTRVVEYRKQFNITQKMADGTAANIVAMVFGNIGRKSGTGVVFTRDPATGEKRLYGDFLENAQGEDIVSGSRTPLRISEMRGRMPLVHKQLEEICDKLEGHYKEPQDIEFTVENGKLFVLQCRAAKMGPSAAIKAAVDMVHEGIITKEEALLKIEPESIEILLCRRIDPNANAKPIDQGIAASPGAATGKVILDSRLAERLGKSGEKIILVREETKPEDVPAFFQAQGILTVRGGKTSHAAVVARGMGKPCIVGCGALAINAGEKYVAIGRQIVKEGETITIDGTTGDVYTGDVPKIEFQLSSEAMQLLEWADDIRALGVRANADTPEAAALARSYGAEGIGLDRTERMFNLPERLPIVVKMIMAEDMEERIKYLEDLLPLQKKDFKGILKVMEGMPVTIRLLDPPLHEFLPRAEDLSSVEEKERMLKRSRTLAEINPMLGHRGVRLGITNPEIYEMQVRAVMEAAAELILEGADVKPEIMVPNVADVNELRKVRRIVERVKEEIENKYGVKVPIKYGTMLEVVRACLTASAIAEEADFFSFGTNDLTQGTFSFSREDAENKFMQTYLSEKLLPYNPFKTLDESGVAKLMEVAIKAGKGKVHEIGICGEHGGDPQSIETCHRLGLTYVSASPFRVPVARLAAAQAAIREKVFKHKAASSIGS